MPPIFLDMEKMIFFDVFVMKKIDTKILSS